MSTSVPRLVAVWVPDWPVVALTLEARAQRILEAGQGEEEKREGTRLLPDPALAPVAVVGGRGVQAASEPARLAGVRVGMRLRVARSLCPGLVVLPPHPDREARSFETVMDSLGSLLADPLVARPGLALSGARGPSRWSGGEEVLAEALVEAVAQGPGLECQVGIADSLLGAVLAARRGIVVEPGGTQTFLAPWPLEAVLAGLVTSRARQEARDLLAVMGRLGLRTLGDLAALPGRDVAARFGPTGQSLHLLARGESRQVPRSERPASDVVVECLLDPPVERANAAAFTARSLAEALCARLVSRGLAAGRLRVEARCENGAELSRSWMLEAMTTPSELTDRVRWQIEGWLSGRSGTRPDSALVHLRLSALELVPAGAAQAGLWSGPGEHGRRRAQRAAQRVMSLLGSEGVRSPVLVPGRDPRSRVRTPSWEQPQEEAPPPGPWAGSLPTPSPSLVLREAVPVRLAEEGGQEVTVSGEGRLEGEPWALSVPGSLGGQEGRLPAWLRGGRVLSWAGPWPVDEGWWRPEGASRRAYLQVVTDAGPPLLLVRSGGWWVEAAYC